MVAPQEKRYGVNDVPLPLPGNELHLEEIEMTIKNCVTSEKGSPDNFIVWVCVATRGFEERVQ